MFRKLRRFRGLAKNALKQNGVGRKVTYMKYAMLAIKNGVVSFRIDRIAKDYTDNYYLCPNVSNEDKKWFAQRGYAANKLPWYGLDRDNYKDYISDFVFYNKKNYINKGFDVWFDNKLTTYYLLAPFKKYMPIHYFYKDDEDVFAVDGKGRSSVEQVLSLAKDKELALKSTTGGHGEGFYKLEYDGKAFLVNGKAYTEPEAKKFIGGLNGYIFTEYAKPHHMFETLCGKNAFAVMRIYMINDKNDGPQMIAACIRLGSKASGYVTGYEGTVYCGIELQTGKLFRQIYMKNDLEYVHIDKHPDTGRNLEDVEIINWNEVKELTRDISEYISMTPYLVIDIIPTDNSFKVLEINSHGQFAPVEAFYPAMKNKYVKKLFKE